VRVIELENQGGRFLPITGEDGHAWCEAARQLAAEADVPLDVLRIGHLDGDYHDPRCDWQRHRQIASDGVILVRPDRFIAWRYPAAASDPRAVLTAAQPDPWAQTVCSARAGRFLTGAGAAQR
jgi:2,4-dichlorophenol 6-monooxygenase